MREKTRQFIRAFEHVYRQWFSVPGRKVPEDNEPLTDEEMDLAAEISDYCEQLFYQITAEQDAKSKDKEGQTTDPAPKTADNAPANRLKPPPTFSACLAESARILRSVASKGKTGPSLQFRAFFANMLNIGMTGSSGQAA